MRARTSTTVRRKNAAVSTSSTHGASAQIGGMSMDNVALTESHKSNEGEDEEDCNGKQKISGPRHAVAPSFSNTNGSPSSSTATAFPTKATFRLPPPPKMTSLAFNSKKSVSSASKNDCDPDNATSHVNGHSHTIANAENDSNANGSSNNNNNNNINNSASSSSLSLPPPTILPIPSPQDPSSSTFSSTAYQRGKTNINAINNAANTIANASDNNGAPIATENSNENTTNISCSSYSSFNNPSYSSQPPQISQPYKPSTWYANARHLQKKRQRWKYISGIAAALAVCGFLWWALKYLRVYLQEEMERHSNNNHHHRHHDYHHHHQGHLNAMMGVGESPLGFARDQPSSSQKEIPQSTKQQQKEHQDQQNQQQQTSLTQLQSPQDSPYSLSKGVQHFHEVFSTVPVATLSNNRLLPYIGFGVASRSVEHKQIPAIVATLLQYASAETEGGGGIAMIDAVIDEEKDAAYNDELESTMAKTVITLVGRAITYFGKEVSKRRAEEARAASGLLRSAKTRNDVASPKSYEEKEPGDYDYENRLEIHLLIGISGSDIGSQNTIQALRNIVMELDGLIPSIPHGDLVNTDVSQWKFEPSHVPLIDRHVDVRLHVLLRSPRCKIGPSVVPCSTYASSYQDTLNQWIGSWKVLEKLYDAKIIHGIGLDGTSARDLSYLLHHSNTVPQLYRGDASQALDGYGRRMDNGNSRGDERVALILKEKGVTFLASNVAGHILEKKEVAPHAYALLEMLGEVVFRAHHQMPKHSLVTAAHKGAGEYYTVPRLVLAYLIRNGVCALPHAYKPEHLADDAPESVGGLAALLTERRVAEIGVALKALLSGQDLPENHGLGMEGEEAVSVVFHNELEGDAYLVKVVKDNNYDGKENEVIIPAEMGGTVPSGSSVVVVANVGDVFAAYRTEDGKLLKHYEVHAEAGGADDFAIVFP